MKRWIAVLLITLCGFMAWARSADDPETLRREALTSSRLRAQWIFSGESFPKIDFEQPALMKSVLGDYTISVTWYDSEQSKVTAPGKPGRYGAIVQINLPDGKSGKRFQTFFRQTGGGRGEWKITGNAEPPQSTGIDPAVASEQSEAISEFVRQSMRESMFRDSRGAVLLSALYETKPGDIKMRALAGPAERDREWWVRLKQKTRDYQMLKYLLHIPEAYPNDPQKKWPMIVFLHGAGERGDNLELLKTHGPPKIVQTRKDFPFIVISPQCRLNEWWSPTEVMMIVDEVCGKYRVDQDRVYLTGLSMGGYGTWQISMIYPDRFAAIAPICGGGDPTQVSRIKHLPIWVFHGGKDPVVPLARAEEMVDALKKIGADVKFTVYPEAGHDSWTETYNNPQLYEWFLSHPRGKR